MRRLTSLDAFFLATEDERTVANVSALAILERKRANGRRLTRHAVKSLFAQRLHLLPPLRWQLAEVPLGVAHPSWVDGPVDLDFHVREFALAAPGDDAALAQQVARLAAEPMNRSRPLWEAYLIHGLSGDRVALLIKLHHAAVDGVSGGEILGTLLDESPHGREIPPAPAPQTESVPNRLGMLVRGLADVPRQQLAAVGAVRPALTHLDKVATIRSLPGVGEIAGLVGRFSPGSRPESAASSQMVAPRTAFNARITPNRSLALVSLPLPEVLQLKEAHGATVNDIVVALCAGALRTWLAAKDELPDERLLAMVPVSVRTAAERGVLLPQDADDIPAKSILEANFMGGSRNPVQVRGMDVELGNARKIAEICLVKERGVRQVGGRNTLTLHGALPIKAQTQARQCARAKTNWMKLENSTIQIEMELVPVELGRAALFKSQRKTPRLTFRPPRQARAKRHGLQQFHH